MVVRLMIAASLAAACALVQATLPGAGPEARGGGWEGGQATAACHVSPGTYTYFEDDGEGHIFIDVWQLHGSGRAERMGRMSKRDYTWRPAGEPDALGRETVLMRPVGGDPAGAPVLLAYDEGLGALCEPCRPEARRAR